MNVVRRVNGECVGRNFFEKNACKFIFLSSAAEIMNETLHAADGFLFACLPHARKSFFLTKRNEMEHFGEEIHKSLHNSSPSLLLLSSTLDSFSRSMK